MTTTNIRHSRTYATVRNLQVLTGIPLENVEAPSSWVDNEGLPILEGAVCSEIKWALACCELTDGPLTFKEALTTIWAEDYGCVA
jgi:hypothetical protein